MNSKIIGVLAATAQGNIDPENLQTAAWVAENGTRYNYLFHDEVKQLIAEREACKDDNQCKKNILKHYAELDDDRNKNILNLCEQSKEECNNILDRLAKEEDDIFKLINAQPDLNTRLGLGSTVPLSNANAQHLLSGELSENTDFELAFAGLMAAMATGAGRYVLKKPSASANQHVDILSPQEKQHILYGDNTGGGHLWPGRPGKTAFPKDWTADKIIHEVGDIATSPNTQWYVQTGNGGKYTANNEPARWAAYEVRDGVRIRVIFEPATGKVISAFPDNNPIPKYKPVR